MGRLLVWIALLAYGGLLPAADVQQRPLSWSLAEGLCEPETVLHDSVRDLLIVSNICGFKTNGRGYLSQLHPDGSFHLERWIDGLNAPAGMAIKDRYLYVADLDRVRVFHIDEGREVETLKPDPPAKALNDVAIDDDWVVYVSDSAQHQIIKIERDSYARFPAGHRFEFANGLHVRGRELWVGGTDLNWIDLDTETVHRIDVTGLDDVDGIESDGAGGLTISRVGGRVWQLPKQGPPIIWTAPGVSSTNHAYLPGRNLIVVPTGYDNTVLAFTMSKPCPK